MTIRPCRWLVACLWLLAGCLSLMAAEIDIIPAAPPPAVDVIIEANSREKDTSTAANGRVAITITTDHPGNLYRLGEAVSFIVLLVNPGDEERVSLTTRVASANGCQVYTESAGVLLPGKGEHAEQVKLDAATRMPNGPYRVDAWVEGKTAYGYGFTLFGVWDGPAAAPSETFGISYAGPLDTPRARIDLELFKQAGIRWLRFPLQGWLPQGNAVPPEAERYKSFVREASERGFTLLSAFTPTLTLDPAINPAQADKEYRESLLAAATLFGAQVPYWELLRVKPDPLYPELRGIRSPELARGRAALRTFNKHLTALFSLETPFLANAQELTLAGLPMKEDILGLRYDFIGLPETKDASPKPPLFEMETVGAHMKSAKRTTPVWITEYGFDPKKGDRIPGAIYQAALMSRAFIMGRMNNITRTFWRHNPAAQFDLPFTTETGAAQPSLLAMRTTLAMLEGKTLVGPVSAPAGMYAFLFASGNQGKKKADVRYLLVVWTERTATATSVKSASPVLKLTDLWGNAIELNPVDNSALISVDEFPRFLDLGAVREVELIGPFAHFEPSRVILKPKAENVCKFHIVNDPRVFAETHIVEANFRRWPHTEEVKTEKTSWRGMYDWSDWFFTLTIPAGARKGQIYEVSAELIIGTRRIGYLQLPVWYSPDE